MIVGLSFMALGVYSVVGATSEYRRELPLFAQARYSYHERRPLALSVAVVLALIGAVVFIGILVQAAQHGINH